MISGTTGIIGTYGWYQVCIVPTDHEHSADGIREGHSASSIARDGTARPRCKRDPMQGVSVDTDIRSIRHGCGRDWSHWTPAEPGHRSSTLPSLHADWPEGGQDSGAGKAPLLLGMHKHETGAGLPGAEDQKKAPNQISSPNQNQLATSSPPPPLPSQKHPDFVHTRCTREFGAPARSPNVEPFAAMGHGLL